MLFFLGWSPISWHSAKQKVVALSSCEAEYITVTTAACQGIWLSRLLAELTGAAEALATLKVDNKSAISLCKNPVYHERSKHIDVRFHYIRQCVDEGKITVEFTGTVDQLADLLTKPLGRIRFLELRDKIGIVNNKESTGVRG